MTVETPERLLPSRPGEEETLAAARRFLDEGLRDSGSVFAPGTAAWGRRATQGLYEAFVRNPDSSGADFIAKLTKQLEGSDDDVILLAAELIALLVLPLHDWKPATKRARVNQVLAMMSRPVAIDPQVEKAFEYGIFNGSLAFKTQIWRALATGIETIRAWWNLDDQGRRAALADPWKWQALTESLPSGTTPAAKAELCYLRHPQAFLPIISQQHRRLIRDAFADQLSHPTTPAVERDLLEITLALQRDTGGAVDYYQDPLHSRWQVKVAAPLSRAWLVRGSAVSGVNVVGQWLEDGFVSLAASHLRTVGPGVSLDDLRTAVESDYAHLSYNQRQAKLTELNAFLNRMAVGDAIATTSEGKVYVGRVDGNAVYGDADDSRTTIRRATTWNPEGVDFVDLPEPLQARLKSSATVVDLTNVVESVEALLQESPEVVEPPTAREATLPNLTDETVDRLLIGGAWLREFVDLLRDRRQVILYGPPGTGKTYLALEVASALTDPANVTLVQFHPAYSYEDFFEGYRPVTADDAGRVGFALTPGPFRKVVDQAREDPGTPYILIIDEINRANLAKVFGELYFLLEYRDRPTALMYGADEGSQNFTLPKNVYIVGTMNTADRSIALVDAAMRRRFAFVSLHPDDHHMSGVLRSWLTREQLRPLAADLLDKLNARIPEHDFKVGPSYLMRPEVETDHGLDRIWRTSILPLLDELHYGDTSINVAKRYGLASLRAELGTAAPAIDEGAVASSDESPSPPDATA